MGSGASVTEGSQPERQEVGEAGPRPDRTSTPAGPQPDRTSTPAGPRPDRTSTPARPEPDRSSTPARPEPDRTSTPARPEPDRSSTPARPEPDRSSTPARPEPDRSSTPARPEPDRSSTPARPEPDRSSTPARPEPDRSSTPARPEPDRSSTPARPEPDRSSTPARPEPDRSSTPARPEPDRSSMPAGPQSDRTSAQARPEPNRPPVPAGPEPDQISIPARPEPDWTSTQARPEPDQTSTPARPEPDQTSTPSGRSSATLQAEEEEAEPESHCVEIQSLKSEQSPNQEEEGTRSVTESVAEGEPVSLDFESFFHNNGTLYSCFNHHGNRVYVDESQNLQPFPTEWYSQGHFITTNQGWDPGPPPASSQPAVRDNDRIGSVYIQGRGSVMTYMFEERVNVCRFWDPQAGVWLLLPLQWELDVEFVKHRVQRVMSTLPGLVDQKEITAALRQCNYDPEEVVSVYLAMFGEILLHASPSADHSYTDLNSFRALLERDQVIEDLRHKLQSKEKEADAVLQRNGYLLREVRYLTDAVQHLNHNLAELEADHQEAREKIRSLLNRRAHVAPAAKTQSKPAVEPEGLRRLSRLTRELNVSNKQLRSTVRQALSDMNNQQEQLQAAVGRLAQLEQEAAGEVEELRSLYRKEAVERRSLYNKVLELQGNIRVFCRCRSSSASSCCVEKTSEQEVVLSQKGTRKKFQFDKVYAQSSTQEEVFAGTLPVITSCVDGYNVCILAYGQTGSGKTYTMMGSKENPGVNIRSIRELLRICAENEKVSYTLKISMLEIYNDTLNDLLTKTPGTSLELRVQGKSVSVPGLTQIQVQTEADILNAMETGEKNRKIASTKMNIQSSRSHLVVALQVEGWDEVSGLTSRGTLTLCDLAGSERISKTEAQGQRLVEAAAINKSLTALGQVFSALKCNALHIPFRNSKLTHLLQPCLSGDAKCCVLVNVSPAVQDEAETLSTLQFGSSIRQVALGRAAQNLVPAKGGKTK